MSEKNRNIYLLKSLSLVYGGMIAKKTQNIAVMPRKRHVSRNLAMKFLLMSMVRHASQEACE